VHEEIIDVVKAIDQGTPGKKMSLYVLITSSLRKRLKISRGTEFVVLLMENGDIAYRRKEA
jgi:hypothetical protein